MTLWRVYYVDEKYTYLAAQSPIGDFNLFEESSKYPEGFEVSLVGQKLNYRVSSILNSSKDSKAVLATAWLTGYEPFDGIVHLVHATKYLMYGYNNERYWFASPR